MAKRILVVEDNDLNRKLFCDVLRAKGYEVLGCADGNAVIESARRFRPDLAIMDIQLPHVSGLEKHGRNQEVWVRVARRRGGTVE